MTSSSTGRPRRVSIQNLSCTHGRLVAVKSATFNVEPGEHIAILGANGSGKTTLLRSIGGLHRRFTGTIQIDGVATSAKLAAKQCAWVPQRQSPGRFPLLVGELLDSSSNPESALRVGRSLGLTTVLRRPVSTLSGGQLQRALLARAIGSLDGGAGVLLADEPSAALDFDGQSEVGSMIRDLGTTVIVSTHDRSIAAICDRRYEMAAGEIREID